MIKASIALLLLLAAVFVSAQGPALLVKREILNLEIVAGFETVINYEIYNVGHVAAVNVDLDDDTWSADKFEVISGLTDAHWDRIGPGANVSHVVVVKARGEGEIELPPAVVTYRSGLGGDKQKGYSNFRKGPIPITTTSFTQRRSAAHFREWGVFLGLAALSTAVPFGIWFSSKSASVAKKED